MQVDPVSRLYWLRPEIINWVTPYFKDGDYQLTLTFRPDKYQYLLNYRPNLMWYSSHIKHYLNVINLKFYGAASRKGRLRLNSAHAFELNKTNGVHVHMILEAPRIICRVPVASQIHTLETCWLKLKYSGVDLATKIERTEDSHGWIGYIFKDISTMKDLRCDYSNWHVN